MPFLDFPSPPSAAAAATTTNAVAANTASSSWCRRGHPLFHNFLSCPLEALMNACSPSNTPSTPSASVVEEEMDQEKPPPTERLLSPEEEQRQLAASQRQKQSGNTLFATAHFLAAIDAYTLALASLPRSHAAHDHDAAILHSNLAACHLQLSAPSLAIAHASEAIARRPGWAKPVLRRCRAREMLGSWRELEAAVADYQLLLARPTPDPTDTQHQQQPQQQPQQLQQPQHATAEEDEQQREAARGLERCCRLLDTVRTRDVADAMRGLRGLGDGLLRPFGFSTADFGMKPDGRGGYSLEFKKHP